MRRSSDTHLSIRFASIPGDLPVAVATRLRPYGSFVQREAGLCIFELHLAMELVILIA